MITAQTSKMSCYGGSHGYRHDLEECDADTMNDCCAFLEHDPQTTLVKTRPRCRYRARHLKIS